MEPIDRVSAVSQIIGTLIIFSLLYIFVLFVILPKIHKVLRIRNFIFENKAKKSLSLNYMKEVIGITFSQFRKKNINEVENNIEINKMLNNEIKQYVLEKRILKIMKIIRKVEFRMKLYTQ